MTADSCMINVSKFVGEISQGELKEYDLCIIYVTWNVTPYLLTLHLTFYEITYTFKITYTLKAFWNAGINIWYMMEYVSVPVSKIVLRNKIIRCVRNLYSKGILEFSSPYI